LEDGGAAGRVGEYCYFISLLKVQLSLYVLLHLDIKEVKHKGSLSFSFQEMSLIIMVIFTLTLRMGVNYLPHKVFIALLQIAIHKVQLPISRVTAHGTGD
jgi:hypothetical protein